MSRKMILDSPGWLVSPVQIWWYSRGVRTTNLQFGPAFLRQIVDPRPRQQHSIGASILIFPKAWHESKQTRRTAMADPPVIDLTSTQPTQSKSSRTTPHFVEHPSTALTVNRSTPHGLGLAGITRSRQGCLIMLHHDGNHRIRPSSLGLQRPQKRRV